VAVTIGVADRVGATVGAAAAVGVAMAAGVGDAAGDGLGEPEATAGSRESCPEVAVG